MTTTKTKVELTNELETEIANAIKSANENPFGFDIITDNTVIGGNFGVQTKDVCQVIKVGMNGNLKSFPTIHGSRYVPMSVKTFWEHAKEIKEVSGLEGEIIAYSLDGGGRIFAVIENKEGKEISIGGHKMAINIFLATSFNGKTSMMIGFNTHFYRCANMYSTTVGTMKHRHTKNLEEVVFNYKAEIAKVEEQIANFEANANELLNRTIDHKVAKQLTQKLVGINANIDVETLEAEKVKETEGISMQQYNRYFDIMGTYATERQDLGENAWAWFNGVTRYTTHEISKAKRDPLALDNRKSKINNEAWKLALSV